MEISKTIKKILKIFRIEPTQCLIIGSAVLYELNIIKSDIINDIDIVLLDNLWEKLSQKYKAKTIVDYCYIHNVRYGKSINFRMTFNKNLYKIEFLDCIGPEKFDFMTKEVIISNGIYFITLENLITFKELLDRPKDHVHIELIKKYLTDKKGGVL